MGKNFIDFIHDAGLDGQLLADYLATTADKDHLGAFFNKHGYAIGDSDLGKLVDAKLNSKNRLCFGQEAFTPPKIDFY